MSGETTGLTALRKTNLRYQPHLLRAAEKYLDLFEAAQRPTEIQGRSFSPRIAAQLAGHVRAEAVEDQRIEGLDRLPRFEDARRSMHHRHALAVDECLIAGTQLTAIGRKFTANKRTNDVTAVAVAMIACGLEDLAKHFRLMGGRTSGAFS